MQTSFKVGEKARVRGAEPVGMVESVADGFVSVRYDHRPGVVTFGYYPVGHVEKVAADPASPLTPALSPLRGEGEEKTTKPKATTKDILTTGERV